MPSRWHLAFNLANGAVAIGVAVAASMSRRELGIDRSSRRAGVALGSLAFLTISATIAGAALLPALRDAFTDGRADVGWQAMVWRAGVVIPLGTVVVEEVIFRGILHGLLRRLLDPWPAMAVGASLFGLWHVFPASRGADDAAAAIGIGAGTLLATTVAGIGFGWLRERSGSVIAPAFAHLATNSSAYVAAWLVTS